MTQWGYIGVGDWGWRQNGFVTILDVIDPLNFYISVRHQHSKDVTNNEIHSNHDQL